ncbi:MAG: hypothetical protein ACK5TO_08985, partial [Planctomycetaceae bacterium]
LGVAAKSSAVCFVVRVGLRLFAMLLPLKMCLNRCAFSFKYCLKATSDPSQSENAACLRRPPVGGRSPQFFGLLAGQGAIAGQGAT